MLDSDVDNATTAESQIITTPGEFAWTTLCRSLHDAVVRFDDRIAFRTLDGSASLTWAEYGASMEKVAAGLAARGVAHGDAIALMMVNRIDFHVVDAGAVCVGATPFSVYNTSPPEAIEYVVSDSGARLAVVEAAFLEQFLDGVRNIPEFEWIVVLDLQEAHPDQRVISFEELTDSADPGFDFEATWRAVRPEDVLALVYTSGTTGKPRGVELTHGSMMQTAQAIAGAVALPRPATLVSALPMAHVAERLHSQYLPTLKGFTIVPCPSSRELLDYVREVHPDWWFSPPRTWQKLKAAIESWVADEPDPEVRERAEKAIAAGLEKIRREQAGQTVPPELARADTQANEVIRPYLTRLGLDRIAWAAIGAAPCPPEIVEFFNGVGVPLYEAWGLTECGAFGAMNAPGNNKIGTVGAPMPGMELKIADDGEIMIRGKAVMTRYRNLPEATAATLDPDGWLHSGDVGSIEDGRLRLLDRKKELIINSFGKNMSPAYIESMLKAEAPLIDQICAIGNDRPFNVAIMTLDPVVAVATAKQLGIGGTDVHVLAKDERILAHLAESVERGNARLSRVEQIKKYVVLAEIWEPSSKQLTPTMKMRRRPISQMYAEVIERSR
jgi:long-chain acyl-CoA synthetase